MRRYYPVYSRKGIILIYRSLSFLWLPRERMVNLKSGRGQGKADVNSHREDLKTAAEGVSHCLISPLILISRHWHYCLRKCMAG